MCVYIMHVYKPWEQDNICLDVLAIFIVNMPEQLAVISDYGPLSQEDWFSSFEMRLEICINVGLRWSRYNLI